MEEESHIVSGIYTSRAEAEAVRARLLEQGVSRERMYLVEHARRDGNAAMGEDNQALKDVLIDGSVGAAVGTVIGALGEVALVATNVSLFFASTVVAPLFMLGWGAFIGGFIGASVGAEKPEQRKEGKLSELVLDAIREGHIVLVTHTRTAAELALVRGIVGDSLAQQD